MVKSRGHLGSVVFKESSRTCCEGIAVQMLTSFSKGSLLKQQHIFAVSFVLFIVYIVFECFQMFIFNFFLICETLF